jgi:membrane protein required for colicin V production
MNFIDITILVLFVIGIIKGIKDGFIRQVAAIGGIFLGFWLAYKFSSLFCPYIIKWIPSLSEATVKIISFVIIIIAVIIAVHFLGKLIEKVITISMLGWLNKLLGIIIAIAATAFIIGLILNLVTYINNTWFTLIPAEKIAESKLFAPLSEIANSVFPYLKNFFKF